MANDNQHRQNQPAAARQPEKPAEQKAPEPVIADPAPAPAPAAKRNLTREQLEGFMQSRLVNEGKSPEEAASIARKRALEMCPD